MNSISPNTDRTHKTSNVRSDLRHAIQALALNHLHYCTLVWSAAGTSATAPMPRARRMTERLACSQFHDLGMMCKEKMKVLRNRITHKWSSYYNNNCLLLNPKARAIKPLTRTNSGQNQPAFRCVLWLLMFSSPPFYSIAYSRWKPCQHERF